MRTRIFLPFCSLFVPVIYCCITNHLKTICLKWQSLTLLTDLQFGQPTMRPTCLCSMLHQLSGLTRARGHTCSWLTSGLAGCCSLLAGPSVSLLHSMWLCFKGMCPKRTRWKCMAFFYDLALEAIASFLWYSYA